MRNINPAADLFKRQAALPRGDGPGGRDHGKVIWGSVKLKE